MQDVLTDLMTTWNAGGTAGVATVVRTFRSSPRPPGAAMVVAPTGRSAVRSPAAASRARSTNSPPTLSGPVVRCCSGTASPTTTHSPLGLTCGGIIDIFVEAISRETFPELGEVATDIADHRPVAIATIIEHPDAARVGRRLLIRPDNAHGSLGSARADDAVISDAGGLLAAGRSDVLSYGPDGQRRGEGMAVFVASYAPTAADAGVRGDRLRRCRRPAGRVPGYRVTVCDARPVFATQRPVPDGRRGRRRLAAPLPGRADRGRARSTRGPSSAC